MIKISGSDRSGHQNHTFRTELKLKKKQNKKPKRMNKKTIRKKRKETNKKATKTSFMCFWKKKASFMRF